MRLVAAGALMLSCALVSSAGAQRGGRGGAAGPRDTTSGFPINDANIIRSCTRCHARDTSSGIVQRLSFMRKTPEGWETSVRRMATLSNVSMTPEVARGIVHYLSNNQGLAPDEAKPGRFESERRFIPYRYTADATTERVCRACHSMGRVILQRRTRDEWDLLIATHRGLYPVADFQAFRRAGPPPADSAGAPQPVEAAIGHLARTFPLRTPEWTAWSASMRPANIEGAWFITGSEPGRGAFFGRTTITKKPGTTDEFTTRTTYRYAKDGRAVTRTGRSLVYTGFQWRGRSMESAADSGLREVMSIEPGWQEMSGRWYKGGYDETGVDITLTRVTGATMIAGVTRSGLRSGVKDQDLTIVGANFPAKVDPGMIELGAGVRVARVVRATPDSITLKVDVDSASANGARDLFVSGASHRGGLVVYDKVHRIKVTPLAGMARVGGVVYPKQFQQFDAWAWHNGPDSKQDTKDDFEIGLVDATWSLDEYGVTYNDDDIKFVGAVDRNGLFTPAIDGPNPQRSGDRNNIGDVWVVATWQPPEQGARPIRGRAHLVVTVALYVRFEPARTAP